MIDDAALIECLIKLNDVIKNAETTRNRFEYMQQVFTTTLRRFAILLVAKFISLQINLIQMSASKINQNILARLTNKL